jgi:hypothetical protein
MRYLRFSISLLLLLALVAAMASWWARTRYWASERDGTQRWQTVTLDHNSTAIIRRIAESDAWVKCGTDFGLSSLVSIESGTERTGFTGGEYLHLFFTLPETFTEGDVIELRPPPETQCDGCLYCSLVPGQIVAHKHGSPFNYRLTSSSDFVFVAKAQVIESSGNSLMIHLEVDATLEELSSPGEYFHLVMDESFIVSERETRIETQSSG